MRVILIDPVRGVVEERSVQRWEDFGPLLECTYPDFHWIVPFHITDHKGLVDEEGLLNSRPRWWFEGVDIWGPMVILRGLAQDTVLSTDYVRKFVRFM